MPAPIILVQPQSQIVEVGEGALFSVLVDWNGEPPGFYQWYNNNVAVGSDTNTYSLTAALSNNGDVIRVDVTNVEGLTSSDDAILTVVADATLPLWKTEIGRVGPIYKGGNLILSEPASGQIRLLRKTPIVNPFAATPDQSFITEAFEFAMDKATMIQQEIEGHACACPEFPPTSGEGLTIKLPSVDDPACVPYACDALKAVIEANNGWPMDDPEVNGNVYTGDFFNGGPPQFDLALPSQPYSTDNFTPGVAWSPQFQYNAAEYVDFPDFCVSGSRMVTLLGEAFQTPRCWLEGSRDIATTLDAAFDSTHVRIGESSGMTLEWTSRVLTSTGSDYLVNARATANVGSSQITVSGQNLKAPQTQIWPVGAFAYNSPYVITTNMTSVPTNDVGEGDHTWLTTITIKLTDINGLTFEHTFTETQLFQNSLAAESDPAYPAYVSLHRSGEADSLGVVFADAHDSVALAVQRNYIDYQLPEYCIFVGDEI